MPQPLSQSERDNLPRWNGKQPRFYEVWFFKFNQPPHKAFWFRFTLLKPLGQDPVAELWAICFDASQPGLHRTFKQRFPLSDFCSTPDGFDIRIGDAFLKQDGSEGSILDEGGRISWKLAYKPNYLSYHPIPPLLMKLPLPKTKACTPHMNLTYEGLVTVDGEPFTLHQARGMQGHLWGTEHAHSWVWAHCNTFVQRPDVVVEALSGRIEVAGRLLPPLSPIYIHYQGQTHLFNTYRSLLRNESSFEPGSWRFAAYAQDIAFQGQLEAAPQDMVGLEYTDPDLSHRYCYNSKIANFRLDVLRRQDQQWQIVDTISAEKTAAVEWVVSQPLPNVPVRT